MRISDWSSDVCSSDLNGVLSHRAPSVHRAADGIARFAEYLVPDDRGQHLARAYDILETEIERGQPEAYDIGIAEIADHPARDQRLADRMRSEEHTSELQSLMRNSYAVFCLNKKTINTKIKSI